VADPATGHAAEPFSCFYDMSDPSRVIAHKTYSRSDVIHCMLWPSLVVVISAVVFLYLEARRSQLTLCGKRPSDGEKSQLKPTSLSSSQHATKVSKLQELEVDDGSSQALGGRPVVVETSSKVFSDRHAPRHRDGGAERVNGQVRSSVDVSVAGTSPGTFEGPSSRRARRLRERSTAMKSCSVSSLVAGADTTTTGRLTDSEERRRAAEDSSRRRPLSAGSDKLIGTADSTSGRCVSESHLDTAV